ncbi:beta-ketoacyl synthase N-terminal-like domain-containing protein [Streptomyces sp. P1-3]|uniref:beta-ketoacyl synthase N-terminal-like domain-containing protein n=1 Tax=Streptomyces sp. P1-3 TaxID=3421658 RepID=UPI003D35FA07
MAVFLPGARDLDGYWRNIVGGVDAVTDVPAGRWDEEFYAPDGPRRADRVYCRRGGFVDTDAEFDVTRFGIMPTSVPGTEPDQLIALHVAHQSITDAGGETVLPADRQRVGVVLGRGGYLTPGLVRLDQRVRTAQQLVRTLRELVPELDDDRLERVRSAFTGQLGPERPESAIGLVPNLAASRVANRLDLRGPAYTVDAACASSLVAVDHAARELAAGRCDVMLAGGVHHCHDITLWSVFSQLGALSPSQRIRPLHRDADGVLIGEGTGVVVLKRLADAERDGDRVYAVVSGTGVASDGRSASLLNPDPGGQVRAVRQAWDAAGLDPRAADAIGLLEAHGTGTPAGDRAELATLAEVFGPAQGERAAIGSVKSMIGHTMPAAGIAGLIKAALALHHGVLPPTLHCEEPHPGLAGTRFAPLAEARPWAPPTTGAPRRAAVNAFGFGGINAHVVLEQAATAPERLATAVEPRTPRRQAATAPEPRTVPQHDAATVPYEVAAVPEPGRGRQRIATAPEPRTAPQQDAATAPRQIAAAPAPRTAQRSHPARTVVTEPERVLRLAASGPDALAALLDGDDAAVLAAGLDERAPVTEPARLGIVDPTARRLALARKVLGKGKPWHGRSDVWFSPAPLLGPAGGRTAFVFPGLEAEFDPRVAELARHFELDWTAGDDAEVGDVGRHGAAVFQLGRLLDTALRRLGVVPDAVAGHSVGEWTAMACGGIHAADEVDAFLADFDPDGLRVPGAAFAVLGLPADRVLAELADRTDVVLSHDNAPKQSMICGPEDAVQEIVLRLRGQGVIGQILPFRSGFHTPMLAPYLDPIRRAAETYTLYPQTTPVWSATTAAPYPQDPAGVRELFVRHLLEPVRFRLMIDAMHGAGYRAFVQLGAGQLGSLIDDTLADRDRLVVSAHATGRDSLAQLRRVVTALWTSGAAPDAGPLLTPAASRSASGHGAAEGTRPGAAGTVDAGAGSGSGDEHVPAEGAATEVVGPVDAGLGSGSGYEHVRVEGAATEVVGPVDAGAGSGSGYEHVRAEGAAAEVAGAGYGSAEADGPGRARPEHAGSAYVGSPGPGSTGTVPQTVGVPQDGAVSRTGAAQAAPTATGVSPERGGAGAGAAAYAAAASGSAAPRPAAASRVTASPNAAAPVVTGVPPAFRGAEPEADRVTDTVSGHAASRAAAGSHAPAAPATTASAATGADPAARAGVRLDLGGALVSLPAHARGLLGAAPVRSATPADDGVLDRLGRSGAGHPAAAELSALLYDTAALAGVLLDARAAVQSRGTSAAGATSVSQPADARVAVPPGTGGPRPAGRGPQPAAPLVPPGAPVTSAGTPRLGAAYPGRSTGPTGPAGPSAAPEPPAAPGASGRISTPAGRAEAPAPVPPAPPSDMPLSDVLRVDVAEMPYLLDHCFFRQRPGWPDEGDRWPIVPATTVVTHLMDIAERTVPGMRAVAVHDVRLLKWIEAIPAVDVPVQVRRTAPDRIHVSLVGSSEAVVELAPRYTAPPAPWPVDPAAERVPGLTAEQLYSERWMFHGPRFQGVSELTAIGDRHVRGVLTDPGAPGALLDNVGQLLGYWIMATLTERTTVFPVRMEQIRFHGPHPRPGDRLECAIRITDVTDSTLTADMQLVHDGRVWARFSGWQDRRFDTDPNIRAVDRFPGSNTLSTLRPEGWAQVHERWPDLATRELIRRNVLGGDERAHYEQLPPVRRRQWLLGRIAAKDAVRGLLWTEEPGDVYPAEIAVRNDAEGRPTVHGVHGRVLGDDLVVSLAHRAEAGVAIARRGPCGIDVEEVAERPRATIEAACDAGELALLDARVATGTDGEAVWFTRFWAAKEAVAKHRGTGLRGRPADFRVVAADADRLRVETQGASYDVRVRRSANPPGLPEREYVVAWTAGGQGHGRTTNQENRHEH